MPQANSSRNIISTFPARLRQLREQRGLTREQLGAAARCSYPTVAKLERGERAPSFELAARLADALGVPTDALRQAAT